MAPRSPCNDLITHEVVNQPEPLENYNLYDTDLPLQEALSREGGSWAEERLRAMGARLGQPEILDAGRLANENPPRLRAFDPWGRRIDEVEFHPAYHTMFSLGVENEVHSIAWTAGRPGAHVVHAALEYLLVQVEAGVCCPLTMTYAVIPALRHQPDLAEEWRPRLTSRRYDPRCIPATEKAGATAGMAMTEKQGGSDVRANSTRAEPTGVEGEFLLTGHKWFCSAPMSDAFLALAHTERGLTCFFVPRWKPDGTRNPFLLQRLKDKLGNRSNASAELEFQRTWARRVGEEGRGVRTIIEMVHHTRLDCAVAAAGLMRGALVQAIHHCSQRRAFGRLLLRQPLMVNVLADLALESEAALALAMRVARSCDEAERGDPAAALFSRIAVAVAKYWNNKRVVPVVAEAMECLGGLGYVEESVLPRLYREAPVNSIWEGSGNVICLDVLRAMEREPRCLEAFLQEVKEGRGADRRLDAALHRLERELSRGDDLPARARRLTEAMALALQGSLLLRHAPPAVADAFCASRLGEEGGVTPGTLPPGIDLEALVQRASPHLEAAMA